LDKQGWCPFLNLGKGHQSASLLNKKEILQMKANKATSQRIKMIALADMEPESGYQRATNPTQVNSIVQKFDETKLGTLIVSERDGKFHVIDGAHRIKALRKLGYTHANCVVLTGLTFEQEAEYFRNQNEDKRGIRPIEFFKAGLVSGDGQCVSINRIVKSNGFNIGNDSKDFYKIGAIQALFTITEEYGYETLDNTLLLLACTWGGIARASQAEVLLGLAEFVKRYGIVDFADRLKDKFSAVYFDYTEIVRTRATSSTVPRKKFCRILVDYYNRGLANRSKKRVVWEE
jgi:hypothetical protein